MTSGTVLLVGLTFVIGYAIGWRQCVRSVQIKIRAIQRLETFQPAVSLVSQAICVDCGLLYPLAQRTCSGCGSASSIPLSKVTERERA